jgi:hypothetical protein
MKPIDSVLAAPRPVPPGWNTPRPEVLPLPTWWPAATAFGITLTAWGLISSVFVLAAGAVVFFVSLAGWIGDIRHERRGK